MVSSTIDVESGMAEQNAWSLATAVPGLKLFSTAETSKEAAV